MPWEVTVGSSEVWMQATDCSASPSPVSNRHQSLPRILMKTAKIVFLKECKVESDSTIKNF